MKIYYTKITERKFILTVQNSNIELKNKIIKKKNLKIYENSFVNHGWKA